MIWENTDFSIENDWEPNIPEHTQCNVKMLIESEDKATLQLTKCQDTSNNPNREVLLTFIEDFGPLLTQNRLKEIANNLLTENCQCFVFNRLESNSVLYCSKRDDFPTLYQGISIRERLVRQTHVDLQKNSIFQLSDCNVFCNQEQTLTHQVCYEIFTIHNSKITKYRQFFGYITPAHWPADPLTPSTKDLMLAKVKAINSALAGKPDLKKVLALLGNSFEYKLWGWDSQKCHIFHNSDLEMGFNMLEESLAVKCIVPYDMYSEPECVIATYVYYLEDRNSLENGNYIWLSTAIYQFDQNLCIVRVNQQGELYHEGEIEIPFEVFSRDRLIEKIRNIYKDFKPNIDALYKEDINFDCIINRFGVKTSPTAGTFEGLKQVEKMNETYQKSGLDFELIKPVDYFVTFDDPSYDIVVTLTCIQGTINCENYKYNGKKMTFICVIQHMLENGKLARLFQFTCDVPQNIPSPFDDDEFQAVNIEARRK